MNADYEKFLLRMSQNTILWSLAGIPALSMPSGSVGGLPVGVQLAGPPHTEPRLASVGIALERALGLVV